MHRGSGLLLHLTSLPSVYGIGDLGPAAYQFADFLAEAGQKYWQILPLTPTMAFTVNSPYSSYSTHAGNTLLISPERLVEDGWCPAETIEKHHQPVTSAVQFKGLYASRSALLREVYDLNINQLEKQEPFTQFCASQSNWLDDFALYVALKEQLGGVGWTAWPKKYRDREPSVLTQARKRLAHKIQLEKFAQYLFFSQWQALKEYCNNKSVSIIGDLPIYVSLASSDVWQNPELFKLNENKQPTTVAGVPPDYFSESGQLWGNPVYDWDQMSKTGFDWWLKRIGHQLELYDLFRLDHFRGLVAFWEIPVGEESAVNGHWQPVPHQEFFKAVYDRFPDLPMIAEDLGTITDDVIDVMKRLGLPGMRIFQFGFSGDLENHPYLPHNYIENCIAYTGTHDNNTALGWFNDDLDANLRATVKHYLKSEADGVDLVWVLIERLLDSKADVVIIPTQDIIGLSSPARMNQPSTTESNWNWRLLPGQLNSTPSAKLKRLTQKASR